MPSRTARRSVSPYLGALGVVGILYGALACLAQQDLKRLIAYSSIGHMGFVLLAISTLTRQGELAANFVNVAHAVITGLLFFVVGGLKERVHGSAFVTVGRGLYARAPKLAAVFAFGAVASLGLPGLAGFWGEMLAMLSALDPGRRLPSSTYLVLMVLAGIGVVLTTAYFTLAIRRVCQARARAAAAGRYRRRRVAGLVAARGHDARCSGWCRACCSSPGASDEPEPSTGS